MKSIIHHPAPNIVPGMNLTAERFEELFAWISTLLGDTVQAALPGYRYGLLIPFDGKAALELEKTGPTLRLSRCCGITPQGTLIAWLDGHQEALTYAVEEDTLNPRERYRVLIEAAHRPRRPFGPESADSPLRPLHSALGARLQLRPYGEPASARPDAFCIGILAMTDGCWELTDYLPPCVHIGAHTLLQRQYRQYCEHINQLMEAMPVIVRDTDSYQEKSMIELREFTLHLGSLLASRSNRYQHLGDCGSPYEVFALWSSVARQASFLLGCLKDRVGFNNLLYENTHGVNAVSYTPQILESALQDMVNLDYHPTRIGEAVAVTDRFLQTIVPIFKALALGHVRPAQKQVGWQSTAAEEKKNNSATW